MSAIASASATVSAVHQSETLLFFTLLQLAIIVLAARVGGAIAQRCGQSPTVGEIIVGILLGPSLFGWFAPDAFAFIFHSTPSAPMQVISQLGLILLMFQIGVEFDFAHLKEKQHRKVVWHVATAGIVFPFVLGLACGYFLAPILSPQANPIASALFIATAFSITALPILGRIMIEFDMTRHPLGVIAISAAAINDVIGWLLLALITTLTTAQFSAGNFMMKLILLALFIAASWMVVRPILKRVIQRTQKHGRLSSNLMGILLVAIFLSAMATYQLGIFAIFGGFILGVLLHDEHEMVRAWKERVGHFVTVFFLPTFFTYTGLRTNIGGLDSLTLWGWCGLIILLATLGKYGGSYLAARRSGLGHNESSILGVMMNTRALMELIVINVGYDLGVISQNMFTMLVLMAIFSTVITTPGLRYFLPKIGVKV